VSLAPGGGRSKKGWEEIFWGSYFKLKVETGSAVRRLHWCYKFVRKSPKEFILLLFASTDLKN